MLSVGSLFSGIGGFDLGLERAGMRVAWQCEIDEFCRAVLAKHWPDVPCYHDIADLDERTTAVDVLCGGFPCQPVSQAGKRLAQDDPRWLWPQFARVIRLLRPRYVVVENVPGLLVRGMGDVLGSLAELGYDAQWTCVSAADVGAPHLRRRVWIVSYPHADSGGREEFWLAEPGGLQGASGGEPDRLRDGGQQLDAAADVADADGLRQQGSVAGPAARGLAEPGRVGGLADAQEQSVGAGLRADESAGVGGRRPGDGGRASVAWATEPDVRRVADGVPARVDRLRALGNALVPQIAQWIGQLIVEREEGLR